MLPLFQLFRTIDFLKHNRIIGIGKDENLLEASDSDEERMDLLMKERFEQYTKRIQIGKEQYLDSFLMEKAIQKRLSPEEQEFLVHQKILYHISISQTEGGSVDVLTLSCNTLGSFVNVVDSTEEFRVLVEVADEIFHSRKGEFFDED